MNVNPKVTAAVLAAAVTTIIAWLLTLAGLVGREQGLSVDDIKQAVTEAIAAGLTITVKAGE